MSIILNLLAIKWLNFFRQRGSYFSLPENGMDEMIAKFCSISFDRNHSADLLCGKGGQNPVLSQNVSYSISTSLVTLIWNKFSDRSWNVSPADKNSNTKNKRIILTEFWMTRKFVKHVCMCFKSQSELLIQ